MPVRPLGSTLALLLVLQLSGVVLLAASPSAAALLEKAKMKIEVAELRTEYNENPIGIDARRPRFCWQIHSAERGVVQSGFQIRVAMSERGLGVEGGTIWDSGKVSSDESVHRVYEGPPLKSGQRYYWQVRIWDGAGTPSDWSAPAYWEMGLLEPTDWQADWIEPDLQEDASKTGPVPMLRSAFKVSGEVQQARAYVTSHGLYEIHLNGRRVGDQLFTPGWTSYNKRLQYQTYDVTSLLVPGPNAVGAVVGNGW